MDRITDIRSPQVSRGVRPVDRLIPSKPPQHGYDDQPSHAPYGVVDRVTLSPEGKAMAMRQRAITQDGPSPKVITYGPARHQARPTPRLPYMPDS